MEQNDLIYLRKWLTTYFSKSKLYSLCFDLGINHEILPGDTLEDKARELVSYCFRHDQLLSLLHRCRELRPHAPWPQPVANQAKLTQEDVLIIDTRPLLGDWHGQAWKTNYDEFTNLLELINYVYSTISHKVPTFSFGIKWAIRDSYNGHIFFMDIVNRLPKDDVGHSKLLALASDTALRDCDIVPGMKLEVIFL
ncbi:MAG TPA: hypothetical protein VF177_14780 [Anaerolineae bacterium]